ncbi:hypothetical protein RND81_03G046200 [Saponaria officinalis]|uniref:TF-B3 domain-containing protein n=1 Tax=Saponaria officinalis TaxID=3572 RepID=A0AAW1M3W2_SAPOF
MEGQCEECIAWAQDIYWTHFESMHFIQILVGDFHSQLMIPRKFTENARGKLHDTINLKGPSGTATWQVRLTGCGDDLYLKGGWPEFVDAFSLEENDILIFKYKTGSCFDVLVFDQRTLCEKETSYFIRRCDHLRPANTNSSHELGCLKECQVDVEEYLSEDVDVTPPKKPKTDMYNDMNDVFPDDKAMFVDVGIAKANPRDKEPFFSWVPVKLPSKVVTDKKPKPPKKTAEIDVMKYVFGSSSVTEDRMKEVLQTARKELTEDSFLVVMRPTHVSKKFFLSMPAEWTTKHLNCKKQVIYLKIGDKKWQTKIIFSSKGRGGISFGWKQFALDNRLEELDVLVFKPANLTDEPVQLDVSIFRIAKR